MSTTGNENPQDGAVALNRVVNVLWRTSAQAARQRDGRSLVPLADLLKAFGAAYPSALRGECLLGLKMLADMKQVELKPDDLVVYDLSKLC